MLSQKLQAWLQEPLAISVIVLLEESEAGDNETDISLAWRGNHKQSTLVMWLSNISKWNSILNQWEAIRKCDRGRFHPPWWLYF